MKKITILSIGNIHKNLMQFAIDTTLRVVEKDCEEVVTIEDEDLNIDKYNQLCIKGLSGKFKTEFVMVVQYDGMAVKKDYWDDSYFNYDYIGAPWPDRFTWIKPEEKVGNGGFSMRSAKLIEALKDDNIRLHDNHPRFKNEDAAICMGYHEYLKRKHGITYAPYGLANRFSHEWCNPTGKTLGFHGIWNVPLFFNEDRVIEYIEQIPKRQWLQDTVQMLVANCRQKGYLRAIRRFNEK
jgi:hypothetical protein